MWLPDHSFVVVEHHSLIPSVYGVCDINQKGHLTYSVIHLYKFIVESMTHQHHIHMSTILESCLNVVLLKPSKFSFFMYDGASDEAPRYPKPLQTDVTLFKELKLDVLLHGVNTAGLSAFNRVERCMAPLSHDLVE